MKIIAWNINGIRSLMKEKYLYELIEQENPSIICFGETNALATFFLKWF
jgi:exonuclease III